MSPVIRGIYEAKKHKDSQLFLVCFIYFGLYFTVIFYTCYVNFLMWAFLTLIYTYAFDLEI